jgi:hypothetical protein
LLQEAYEKNKKVVTQMGNQGHAGIGWRMAYEYIKAGALGEIKEFHSWTNRPGWPQGGDRPNWTDPIPDHLDWDAWIGAAPMRPYAGPRQGSKRGRGPYHPFNWRGVVDFGCGALGDMACHITDGIYAIMEPSYATTAEPIIMTGPVKDQWPSGMVVKCTYRAKGSWPGFTTYWYEGKDKDGKPFLPEIPEELKAEGRNDEQRRLLGQSSSDTLLQNQGIWRSRAIARTLTGSPRRVLYGLSRREAARIQQVQLLVLRPYDREYAACQSLCSRRQKARVE